jgi:hypothetical protein
VFSWERVLRFFLCRNKVLSFLNHFSILPSNCLGGNHLEALPSINRISALFLVRLDAQKAKTQVSGMLECYPELEPPLTS